MTEPSKQALNIIRYRDPILDSINEGVFTVSPDWRITSFNRAAETITGLTREAAIGRRCCEVFRANICEDACALKAAIRTGNPASNARVYVIDAAGRRVPLKVSAAVLHDINGEVIGGVETFQDLRQVEALRKKLQDKHTVADIVGKSPAMKRLFELLPQIADSDSTVLLHGASGTGKELFAHAIHDLSPRRKRPFVAVNCGAIPDTLLESELFGYTAGAFTDAKKDKPGRFAAAKRGTLFLDEIGDISSAMQVRLLRVLQEKMYEPLGAVTSEHADVRILAATNKDLKKKVEAGAFREDLFYRIHVIRVDIPPLSDRREDIPILVDHFITEHNRLHDGDIAGLTPEAFSRLMNHAYPGNIRELQNILEHAFVLCRSGMITPDHLPTYLRERDEPSIPHKKMNLKEVEKMLIEEALQVHRGNRKRAAAALGINSSTLYRKIKHLGINAPQDDGRGRRGN